MTKRYFLPGMLLVLAVWASSPRMHSKSPLPPDAGVVRLLGLPPEEMELTGPLWNYRAKLTPAWVREVLESGMAVYTWEGFLDFDDVAPRMEVRSAGHLIPTLPGGDSGGTREGVRLRLGRPPIPVSQGLRLEQEGRLTTVGYIPSSTASLVFEEQCLPRMGKFPRIRVEVGETAMATFETRAFDWETRHIEMKDIEAGTHEIRWSLLGPFDKPIPGASFRNIRFEDPVSAKVFLPSASPAPEIEYRPREPLVSLLKEKRTFGEQDTEPRKNPWSQYDQDRRWVRPIEFREVVRTSLFLPTPSSWRVRVEDASGTYLTFFPMVHNERILGVPGQAILRISADEGDERKILWEGLIGPEDTVAQRVSDSAKTSSNGIGSEPLTKTWGGGISVALASGGKEGLDLLFESLPVQATATTQPLILGEPMLLPGPRLRHRSAELEPTDILDWQGLARELVRAGKTLRPTPRRQVWLLMDWRARVQLGKIGPEGEIAGATQSLVLRALNEVLARRDFYQPSFFRGLPLDEAMRGVVEGGTEILTPEELVGFNRDLLDLGFPEILPRKRDFAPHRDHRPDIVLISVDTLRGDSLSCLGHWRETSPWMTQFFGVRGARFYAAESPSTWTLPAHAGLFLSQYVSRHGIRGPDLSLSPEVITLAERLAAEGYETAAFVDKGFLHYRYGFSQGFERFDQRGGGFGSILPNCLNYLRNRDRSAPLFLFLHTYDVHDPYDPPEPFRSRFLTADIVPAREDLRVPTHGLFDTIHSGGFRPSALEVEYMRALYDGGILFVDRSLERFFEVVNKNRFLHDPWTILVSDHGEGFGEHGYFDHGKSVYQELTHIPILMRFPGDRFKRAQVSTKVSLIDIGPTLFDWLGLATPEEWQGQSLLPCLENPNRPSERRIYSENADESANFHALMKVIRNNAPKQRPDGKWLEPIEAYNLKEDPEETQNLIHTDIRDLTREVEHMTKTLEQMNAQATSEGRAEAVGLDSETIDQLQTLGYLR